MVHAVMQRDQMEKPSQPQQCASFPSPRKSQTKEPRSSKVEKLIFRPESIFLSKFSPKHPYFDQNPEQRKKETRPLNVEKPNRTKNIVPYVKNTGKKSFRKNLVPSDLVPFHSPVKDGRRKKRERESHN
jgi:hypothetical protein